MSNELLSGFPGDPRTGAFMELRQAYEHVAASVLDLSRGHGYVGQDPGEALEHVRSATQPGPVAEMALELWRTFFTCFRPDEKAFEAARFQAAAARLDVRLAELPPEALPDAALVAEMLAALAELWRERHHTISQRLDILITDLGQHQTRLGTAELSAAHRSDELERVNQVVQGALAELGIVEDHEPPGQRTARLIARYREDLGLARKQAHGQVQALKRLMEAIRAVASGAATPPLPPEAEILLADVRRLDNARRELERTQRDLHAALAKQAAENQALKTQVQERDQRLAQCASPASTGEEALILYRRMLATWESGGDLKTLAERLHHLERVLTLPTTEEQRAAQVADRHLAELAKCLEGLFRLCPRGEDPKRFRPRLFSSRYEFKTLAGQIIAIRDAAHDLAHFIERARWAQGVGILAKQAAKLRQIFREMVALVAHWRLKMGDPPPVSISINIDGSGVVSLPAILASDLDMMLRKSKRLGPAAAGLAQVLEASIVMYHRVLEQAIGEPIARVPGGKRESALQTLTRLTSEMAALAGRCEAVFSEVAASNFVLAEADAQLLADEHLLRMALTSLDGACAELATLPNVPEAKLAALPSRGKELSPLLPAIQARCAWLDLLACYRVVVG